MTSKEIQTSESGEDRGRIFLVTECVHVVGSVLLTLLAAAGHAGHFRGGRSANGSFELLATLIVGPPLIWLCSLPIAIAIYKSTVKDWTGTPALPIALYCMGLVLTAMAFSLVAMAG